MFSAIKSSSGNISKRDIILLLFVASMLFLWSNGFNLRLLELGDNFRIVKLVRIFMIVVAIGLSVLFARGARYFQNYYFRSIIGLLLIVLFPTIFNSVIVYGLGLKEILLSGHAYCGFFIFILLISYRTDSAFVARLNTIVLAIATVSILSLILLSRFPAVADSIFVRSSERFDSTRLAVAGGLVSMVSYSTFYLLVMSTKATQATKSRIFYFLLFCAYVWYYFTVAMGRRTIFSLLIVMCYYGLFHLSTIRKMYAVSALVFFSVLLLSVPQLHPLVDNVRLSYTSSLEDHKIGKGTLTKRIDGIQYYLNEFRNTGYLGVGLISTHISEDNPLSRGRVVYRYNSGDHGILAVLYQFGFPAVVLTIIILFHIFRDLTIIRRRGSPEHQAIAMGIHLYLCFCIVALLQIFWKPMISFWTGLMFFMVWRMREEITCNTMMLRRQQGSHRHASIKGGSAQPFDK